MDQPIEYARPKVILPRSNEQQRLHEWVQRYALIRVPRAHIALGQTENFRAAREEFESFLRDTYWIAPWSRYFIEKWIRDEQNRLKNQYLINV